MNIPAIRKQLKDKAQHMPQAAHGYIKTLDMQIGRFANADESDKAALRPVIEESCVRIERLAHDGR